MNRRPHGSQYSMAGYRIKVRTTRDKLLLVEGVSDKLFFQRLLDRMSDQRKGPFSSVVIDTSEMIQSSPGSIVGNREKVEQVCHWASRVNLCHKIIGFVDREFRGFVLTPQIRDELKAELDRDCVVWSRGHSLENYMFDVEILIPALEDSSGAPDTRTCNFRFQSTYPEIVRIACALSLVANEDGRIQMVLRSISAKVLVIRGGSMHLDIDAWRDVLIEFSRLDRPSAETIAGRYNYWLEQLSSIDVDSVKWLIHGHIGMRVMWSAYGRCLLEATPSDAKRAGKLEGTDEMSKMSLCCGSWMRWGMEDVLAGPGIVFRNLLGLSATA